MKIHCDEYDKLVSDLVDTAWTEAGAEKYEDLTKA